MRDKVIFPSESLETEAGFLYEAPKPLMERFAAGADINRGVGGAVAMREETTPALNIARWETRKVHKQHTTRCSGDRKGS